MNYFSMVAVIFYVFTLISTALTQMKDPKDYKVGEIIPSIQAQGGGKNLRNFQAGYNVGLGTKVWESKRKDMSLELGANYGQGILRHEGHTFKSKPQYGFGGTFRFGRR